MPVHSRGPVARAFSWVCPRSVVLLSLALSAHAADIDAVRENAANGPGGFRPLVTADRTNTPVLAPASREGEIRIKQFKTAPGVKVDLWAAEPMLANPVAFAVDERGRVFTSETYRYRSSVLDIRHYMFMLEDDLAARSIEDRLKQIRKWFGPDGERQLSQETEVVRLIEDTDGDGRADKSRVFADGLNSRLDGIASGVLARHGEVWLTDIPSVWRFVPGNGANRTLSTSEAANAAIHAPRVLEGYRAEELLRGFGVRFSFTGHDLHGLKFGPDGRLYFSCGDRGTHLVTKEGRVIDLPDEGAVFRCEPDGSNLEVVHHGLRNPQELAFNEYGDLFTGDNDSDQGDRERWVQVIEGADSGWRVGHQHAPLGNAGMWNLERLWVPPFDGQAAYVLPPLANIGDGPSGLVYDYGTGLDASLRHRFLLAYFKGTSAKSGVCSIALRPHGASYEMVAHDEFVWNSLVPDVDIGPDGAVWFADWHEGWPKSNKGRIYRAYFPSAMADPVVKETQRLLAEDFGRRGEGELLALLTHPDMRVRQEAQFELAGRGAKSFEGLKDVAFGSRSPLARLHAIWALGHLGRHLPATQLVAEFESLIPLVADVDAEVQRHAVRMLADARVRKAQGLAVMLVASPNPRVATAALFAEKSFWTGNAPWRYQAGGIESILRSAARLTGREAEVRRLLTQQNLTQDGVLRAFTSDAAAALDRFPGDPTVRHAVVSALAAYSKGMPPGALATMPGFLPGAGTPVSHRMVHLLVLRENGARDAEDVVLLRNFVNDPSPLIALEAARVINDLPVTNALGHLAALGDAKPLTELLGRFAALAAEPRKPVSAASSGAIRDLRADQPLPWGNAAVDQLSPMLLRVVNANFRLGTTEAAQRLAAMAGRGDLPGAIRAEALLALGSWARPPARDRITGTYRPLPERDAGAAREALRPALAGLLGAPDEAIRVATAESVARLGLAEAAPQLAALTRDSGAPAGARAAALRAFRKVSPEKAAISALIAAVLKDPAEALRLEASKLNAELNPGDAAGQLATKLTSGSLAEQQSAFESLGSLKSDSADAILADWLDKLMKREVANEVMLDLVEAAGKRSASAVASRLAAYNDWKLPKDHLTPYREALAGGDAERGRKIFYERQDVACTRCHKIGNDGGGDVGPNLAGIATRGTAEHILESIVFPNQQIAEGFESVVLTMKNGTSHAGVLKSETAAELVVNSPEDGLLTLKKSEIENRDRGLSGMPEGMGQLLSRRELRDLFQFLLTR